MVQGLLSFSGTAKRKGENYDGALFLIFLNIRMTMAAAAYQSSDATQMAVVNGMMKQSQ